MSEYCCHECDAWGVQCVLVPVPARDCEELRADRAEARLEELEDKP